MAKAAVKFSKFIKTKSIEIGGITWTIKGLSTGEGFKLQQKSVDFAKLRRLIVEKGQKGKDVDPAELEQFVNVNPADTSYDKFFACVIGWDCVEDDEKMPVPLNRDNVALIDQKTFNDVLKAIDNFSELPSEEELKN